MDELKFKFTTFLTQQHLIANNCEEYEAIRDELLERGFTYYDADTRSRCITYFKVEGTRIYKAFINMAFWKNWKTISPRKGQ